MKTIKIKEGSKGHEILLEMKKAKETKNERIKSEAPPKEIIDYIFSKTEETVKINDGRLNGEDFRLGMLCMWQHLNKKV